MMAELLRYDHINIRYGQSLVIEDVDFNLASGEILGIVGESGSGKTAFLEQGIRLASGDGFTVLKTACYKQGEEFYLSPWNDIFQEIKV